MKMTQWQSLILIIIEGLISRKNCATEKYLIFDIQDYRNPEGLKISHFLKENCECLRLKLFDFCTVDQSPLWIPDLNFSNWKYLVETGLIFSVFCKSLSKYSCLIRYSLCENCVNSLSSLFCTNYVKSTHMALKHIMMFKQW